MSGTPTHDLTQRTPPEARDAATVAANVVSSLGSVASPQFGKLSKNSLRVTCSPVSEGRGQALTHSFLLGCLPTHTNTATPPQSPQPPLFTAGAARVGNRKPAHLEPGDPAPLWPLGDSDTRLADSFHRTRPLHTQAPTPHQDVGLGPWPPTSSARPVPTLAGLGTYSTLPSGSPPTSTSRSHGESTSRPAALGPQPRSLPSQKPSRRTDVGLNPRTPTGPGPLREAPGPWPYRTNPPRSHELSQASAPLALPPSGPAACPGEAHPPLCCIPGDHHTDHA